MVLPDFYYTPDAPVIFTMNPFEVHPPTCPATYECINSGPRSGLCFIADGDTEGVFD